MWGLHLRALAAIGCASLLLIACGQEGTDPPVDEQPSTVEPVGTLSGDSGKADGIVFEVRDFFRHTRELVTRDLTDRIAHLATDEINDALRVVPFVDIRVGETDLFGLDEGFEGGSEISGLNDLRTGLTQRYGAQDFVTRINDMRARHIEQSGDRYFAESTFKVDASIDPSFTTDLGDFTSTLGFGAREGLTSRIVAAYSDNVDAILRAPLAAAWEARGFVLPRSAEDVLAMDPGESMGLSGEGVVGLNVAANLPVLSFDPVNHLVITTRFSLGARAQVTGTLDLQLIRGEGSVAYVDLGVEGARVRSVSAGLRSGYGLVDIPSILEVSVGGHTFTVGDIAEKVARNFLNKSGLISYGVEGISSTSESRVTLHRFEIDLAGGGADAGAALAQAMAGDVRLAQTLADRDGSGVRALVSLERDVNNRRRYLGAHVSSMRFFRDVQTTAGRIYIEADGRRQEILFDELRESTGRFFATWGFRRVLLLAQQWVGGVFTNATSNLRVAVSEADKLTVRDQVLDHVDSLLLTAVDFDTLYNGLTSRFEVLQDEVDVTCKECDDEDDWRCEDEYDECVDALITPEQVEAWKGTLRQTIDGELTRLGSVEGFDDALARHLLELKLELSSVREARALIRNTVGRSSVLVDVRATQDGMNELFRRVEPHEFRGRLVEVFTLLVSRRTAGEDKYEKVRNKVEDESERLDDLADLYSEARDRFIRLDDVSGVRIGGGPIGDEAYVLAPVSDEPGDLTLRSLAEQKGMITAELFDALVERAEELRVTQLLKKLATIGFGDALGYEGHHLAAYTLLSLLDPAHRELLVSIDFEEDGFSDTEIFRAASAGGVIEAGEFDLDLLLNP